MRRLAVLFSVVMLLSIILIVFLSNDYTKYQDLERITTDNPDTFFNLATIAYEAGNASEALINYHRALSLNPRDQETKLLLAQIRSEFAVALPTHDNIFVSMADFTRDWVSLNELEWLLWCLIFLGVVLMTTRNTESLKTPLKILGIMTLIVGTCFGTRLYQESTIPLATVITPNTAVYTGAGTDYFVLFTLNPPQEVFVQEQANGWVKIQVSNTRMGWVKKEHIALVSLQP